VKFKTSGNISLKENEIFFSFSQIENQRFSISLNPNIICNFKNPLVSREQLIKSEEKQNGRI